jgi:protein-tyrosine phosphatase
VPGASRSVLFVCFGNICRSPLAEGMFRARLVEAGLADRVAVDSAGTSAYNAGRPPDWRARRTARRHGLTIGGLRARALRAGDFTSFDVIIAMDRSIMQAILESSDEADLRRVHLVADYGAVDEIDDPVNGTLADFERTYEELAVVCDSLLAELEATLPGVPAARA